MPKAISSQPSITHLGIQDHDLDPRVRWLPEHLCPTQSLEFLSCSEQRLINQLHTQRYLRLQILFKQIQLSSDPENSPTQHHLYLFRRLVQGIDKQFPKSDETTQLETQCLKLAARLDDWSRTAFILHQKYSVQAHYKCSLKKSYPYAGLFKDLFFYHWKDEAKWVRYQSPTTLTQREGLWMPAAQESFQLFCQILQTVEVSLIALAEADMREFLQLTKPSLTSQNRKTLEQVWKETYLFTHLLAPVSMTVFYRILNSQLSRKQWATLSPLNPHLQNSKGPQLIRWSPLQNQDLARQVEVEQLCA